MKKGEIMCVFEKLRNDETMPEYWKNDTVSYKSNHTECMKLKKWKSWGQKYTFVVPKS